MFFFANSRLRSTHNHLGSCSKPHELWLWEKHQISQELLTLCYLHFFFFIYSKIAAWKQFKNPSVEGSVREQIFFHKPSCGIDYTALCTGVLRGKRT